MRQAGNDGFNTKISVWKSCLYLKNINKYAAFYVFVVLDTILPNKLFIIWMKTILPIVIILHYGGKNKQPH